MSAHPGMSLRDALRLAERLGCRVEPKRRTGEVRVTLPDGEAVILSRARKDAPRVLSTALARLEVRLDSDPRTSQ